jgi:hypothetical protein
MSFFKIEVGKFKSRSSDKLMRFSMFLGGFYATVHCIDFGHSTAWMLELPLHRLDCSMIEFYI